MNDFPVLSHIISFASYLNFCSQITFIVVTSTIEITSDLLPTATCRPLGDHAAFINPSFISIVPAHFPLFASQIFAVLSELTVSARSPP